MKPLIPSHANALLSPMRLSCRSMPAGSLSLAVMRTDSLPYCLPLRIPSWRDYRFTRLMIALLFSLFSFMWVASPAQAAYKLFGLNFSPFMDGQDPLRGDVVSPGQLTSRLQMIKPYTRWIRTFQVSQGLEIAGAKAHQLGLKAALGANITSNLSANQREIANLIAAANRGEADALIVGSEVLLRAESNPPVDPFPNAEATLIGYLNQVKQGVNNKSIPVTYADTYNQLLEHPNIVAACRGVVMANFYPYWEGIKIDNALADLNYKYDQIKAKAGGKKVVVSEAGWPSAGGIYGKALPASDNAGYYFQDFVSWAKAKQVDFFYFSAFDEKWKAAATNAEVEAHWGIWDSLGNQKPFMKATFDGLNLLDNWNITAGPGTPRIQFTYVSPYGTAGAKAILQGYVWHIRPADYKIGVFIKVNGKWWPKPYWNAERTSIDQTGFWQAYIDTGGTQGRDYNATDIAAFLVTNSFSPTNWNYEEVKPKAVASLEITRPRSSFYLNVDKRGSGTSLIKSNILGIECGLDCSEPYAANTQVKLSAQPAPGYKFINWTGACTGGTTCAVTMNSDKKVTANFALQSFNLSVTNQNKTGGTISGGGINCGPACTRTFPYATIVTLKAVPKQGYLFAGWGGICAAVTASSCRVEVSQARNVSANFAPSP